MKPIIAGGRHGRLTKRGAAALDCIEITEKECIMSIESYFVASPVKGACKSYGIWVTEGNTSAPLVYLMKPRWVDNEQWSEIVNALKLELPSGYCVGKA